MSKRQFLIDAGCRHSRSQARLDRQSMRMSDHAETIVPLQVRFGMEREGQAAMKRRPPLIGIVRNFDVDVVRDENFRFVEFQSLGDELPARVTVGIQGHGCDVSRRFQRRGVLPQLN